MSEADTRPCYWGVVPAAGLGERMGAAVPKQYLELAGQTVISHTVQRMLDWEFLQGLLVALHRDDKWWPQQAVASDRRVETVVGGDQRCYSVLAALKALGGRAAPQDWVLVHDAVRPCIRREDVESLRTGLEQDAVGGLLALPVAETVKRADTDGRVEATLDRQGLWLAQTPQMFRYGQLLDCLQVALDNDEQVTDEAAAIELAGLQPRLIAGAGSNIKITMPADLATAEAWLARGE
ncbi:MAG: 2-C-methyl-D-erythritol 4-phosphate cytidylyltransferase [Gammaproteobacteria bacterium]|nr:2-C-methyl-D-erythritol 4-phosphate cytidylyltransferase [Gammaproteobacteria bacterium]